MKQLTWPAACAQLCLFVRRNYKNALLLLGTSLLCLGLMELAVRVAAPQPPSWLAIYRQHPRLPFFALQPNIQVVVDTGESRWPVTTDADGFRVAANSKETANDLPVALVLGDSFAFGHGVRFEDSFVGRLNADPRRQFRFVDTGVPGYGPVQYAAVLDDLLSRGMKPRLVITATFLGNDFHDTVWNKNIPVVDGVIGGGEAAAFLKLHLHLYRLVSRSYHLVAKPQVKEEMAILELANPEVWRSGILAGTEQRYRDAMSHIADSCRESGADLVFLILPSREMVDDVRRLGPFRGDDTADTRLALLHAHRALEGLDARVLDLTMELEKHETAQMYFRFDGHFTPEGHAVVADLMVREIPGLH